VERLVRAVVEGIGEITLGWSIVWIKLQRAAKSRNRLVDFSRCNERNSEMVHGVDISGLR
jgi:hypothetical protein